MAESLSEAQLGARVTQKLLNLKCPFLEGVNVNDLDAVIQLLCTPSVDRLQILEWLCISCYPPLERKFAELRFQSVQDYGTDLVIKPMTWLGHNLGVCSAEDYDLFLGQESPCRQLLMMDKMLGGLQQYKQITTASTDLTCIDSVHAWNSQLLAEVRNDPHLRSPAKLDFNLSLDAHRLLKRAEANFESRGKKRCSPPSTHSMEKMLVKLSEELKETNGYLEEMKKTLVFLGPTENNDTTFQTLKLTLSDFHQLMTVFSLTFEHEFGMHCNKAPPDLCNFGSLCRAVHKLLTSCVDELAALAEISDTCRKLETIVNGLQQDVINWEGGDVATLPVQVNEVKKKYTEFLEVFRAMHN
ncbi:HAUS augmin-like complex subunit 7 [Chiloscyllium plagiosum]|uniref:HAUS augmin-like complex subunit 7 n=1 Tax=Chiloscyllium plagiosum TaxID=36176 RepID=UPI001CB88228|nr:HAUS augmin-like complex subunit 7 [Chiloscyllium plagiosum]